MFNIKNVGGPTDPCRRIIARRVKNSIIRPWSSMSPGNEVSQVSLQAALNCIWTYRSLSISNHEEGRFSNLQAK
jgi:hypothetical protein